MGYHSHCHPEYRPRESKRGSLRVSTPSTPGSTTAEAAPGTPPAHAGTPSTLPGHRAGISGYRATCEPPGLSTASTPSTQRAYNGRRRELAALLPNVNEHSQSACALGVSKVSHVSTRSAPPRVQLSPLVRMRVHACPCAHTTQTAGAPAPPPPTVGAEDDTSSPSHTTGVSTQSTPWPVSRVPP